MVAPIRVERMPYDLQSYAQLPTYATRPSMFVPNLRFELRKLRLLNEYVYHFHQSGINKITVVEFVQGFLSAIFSRAQRSGIDYIHAVIFVGRVRLELTTRSFSWNFEVTLILAISILGEENIQSVVSFLPALPTELPPHLKIII